MPIFDMHAYKYYYAVISVKKFRLVYVGGLQSTVLRPVKLF